MPQKRPFIADQRMRILQVDGNPREYLSADYFRQLRLAADQLHWPSPEDRHDEVWRPVARQEVWQAVRDRKYLRLVIVTDAGMGKTTTMAWLNYRLNRPGGPTAAFLLDVAELPDDPDLLPGQLAKRLSQAIADKGPAEPAQADRLVKRLRRQGRIVLLLDALDQAADARLGVLNALLGQPAWAECPIVVSGRPYIVEQHLNTQFHGCLFRDYARWHFLQLEDFDDAQQQRYLGGERYGAIPEDARRILSNPRVLYYLSEVPADRMAAIRVPSDVYHEATASLLHDGIRGARGAEGMSALDVRILLSAIAFQMAVQRNFDGVTPVQMPEFLGKLAARCQEVPSWVHGDCQPHLMRLAAMNTILSHGLLEPGCPRQIFWRDRSLQEYFAGCWLSQYAGADDAQEMYRVLCEDFVERTAEFRWVYRFAAEMPAGARNPASWIRAMEPLYRPGDGTAKGTRRWSEMLYRSWATMAEYAEAETESEARAAARRVIESFRGEFQEVLHPTRLLLAEVRAVLRGSPAPEPSLLGLVRRFLRRLRQRRVARRLLAEFRKIPPDAREAEEQVTFWMGSPYHEQGRVTFDARETQREVTLDIPFELACYPVTNEQYKLFNPAHRGQWDEYSPEGQCPVIAVSWYDAWAFCRWLGEGYGLPTEIEWEFACRASRSTDPEESTRGCFGHFETELADYTWGDGISGKRTHPDRF